MILRRIFPIHHVCPKESCGCQEFRRNGSSRGGDLEYRICTKCGYRYVVSAIGAEVLDDGSAVSRVVPA
jgi:DNA polymerase III alpha subunit (gram-positive type)